MRVTQSMISNNMLKNLNKSYSQMDKYMDQMNTGKRINRMSDDPVAGMNALGYRTERDQIEQYERNASQLHNWYDNTDAALDHVTEGLKRVRYLAVQASNGTYEGEQLKAIAQEVRQIKEDLLDVANTKVGDNFIFNGLSMNKAPEIVDGNPAFKPGAFNITVSGEAELVANVNGSDVFVAKDKDGVKETSIFDVLDNFIKQLDPEGPENDGDPISTPMDEHIGQLDIVTNNVVNQRADLGARMNRLDLVENRLGQQYLVANEMVSRNEDVNYAEAITNLITQESIHRAALSSGARIIQPSLLDFLR